MRPILKPCLHLFGSVLGQFGLVFVVTHLYHYSDQIDLNRFRAMTRLLIPLLALLYGAVGNFFLTLARWKLLTFYKMNTRRSRALKAYVLSQIAKDMPGNIFHLAGRQVLGMAAGLHAVTAMRY